MTQGNYTKGTWSYEYDEDNAEMNIWLGEAVDENKRSRYRALDKITVYDDIFPESKGWEEAEANARLIAAAPELLHALKVITEHLALLNWDAEDVNIEKACRVAIAKAEGK